MPEDGRDNKMLIPLIIGAGVALWLIFKPEGPPAKAAPAEAAGKIVSTEYATVG